EMVVNPIPRMKSKLLVLATMGLGALVDIMTIRIATLMLNPSDFHTGIESKLPVLVIMGLRALLVDIMTIRIPTLMLNLSNFHTRIESKLPVLAIMGLRAPLVDIMAIGISTLMLNL